MPLTALTRSGLSGFVTIASIPCLLNCVSCPSFRSLINPTKSKVSERCLPDTLSGSRTRRRLLTLFISALSVSNRARTLSGKSALRSASSVSNAVSEARASSCATTSTIKPTPAIWVIWRPSSSTSAIRRCARSVRSLNSKNACCRSA